MVSLGLVMVDADWFFSLALLFYILSDIMENSIPSGLLITCDVLTVQSINKAGNPELRVTDFVKCLNTNINFISHN